MPQGRLFCKPAVALAMTACLVAESAAVIADFVKWVEVGAPDPRDAALVVALAPRRAAFEITAKDRRYWAFQPLGNAAPPTVGGAAWVRDDLDRFVLA